MKQNYDEYAGSDEDSHDAYLERMKEEGKIREEHANDSSEDSGEETGRLYSLFCRETISSKLLSVLVLCLFIPELLEGISGVIEFDNPPMHVVHNYGIPNRWLSSLLL